MSPVYWIPLGFAAFMIVAVSVVHLYTRWYYSKYHYGTHSEDMPASISPPKAQDILKQILPYRLHCRLGLHTPTVMIQSVTHERKEDVCLECGKKLAVYKIVKVKPKSTGLKRKSKRYWH